MPRGAIEVDAIDGDGLVAEVGAVGEESFSFLGGIFEAKVMVAGDDEFMLVGEGGEPIVKIGDDFKFAVGGYIASVDEDIARGHGEFAVAAVGVTDGDNGRHGRLLRKGNRQRFDRSWAVVVIGLKVVG